MRAQEKIRVFKGLHCWLVRDGAAVRGFERWKEAFACALRLAEYIHNKKTNH